MDISKLNKVLFINFGGIGDEILFFPVLQTFKKYAANCKITLLVEPRSAGCKLLTNLIDDIETYDVKNNNKYSSFIELVKIIRKGKYDAVISSGSNKFISILLFCGGSKIRIGYYSGAISKVLLTNAVTLNSHQYAGNMYHDLLKGLNIQDTAQLPKITIDENEEKIIQDLIKDYQAPIVTIHPGVSKLSIKKNIIKSWEHSKWVALIKKLIDDTNYTVLLTGGPDDDEVVKYIQTYLGDEYLHNKRLINFFGKTSNLSQLAALTKLSDVLICVDSAPMHIGVGVNAKIVALFGPSDELKLIPKSEKIKVVTVDNIPCRPCLWDKRKEICNDPKCLNINLSSVFNAVQNLIETK